jgi:hypothetical protein
VRTLRIISEEPRVEVGLKALQVRVQLVEKYHLVEFLQHRLVEAFADAIGLRIPGLGLRMVDVVDREIQFVVMSVWITLVAGHVVLTTRDIA